MAFCASSSFFPMYASVEPKTDLSLGRAASSDFGPGPPREAAVPEPTPAGTRLSNSVTIAVAMAGDDSHTPCVGPGRRRRRRGPLPNDLPPPGKGKLILGTFFRQNVYDPDRNETTL